MFKLILQSFILINTPPRRWRESCLCPLSCGLRCPPSTQPSRQQRIALVRYRKAQPYFTRRRIERQHLGIDLR